MHVRRSPNFQYLKPVSYDVKHLHKVHALFKKCLAVCVMELTRFEYALGGMPQSCILDKSPPFH